MASAAFFCQATMLAGCGGGTLALRHSRRMAAMASTVTPSHLCQEKYLSLVGVRPGMSVMTRPMTKALMISRAVSQCRMMAVVV